MDAIEDIESNVDTIRNFVREALGLADNEVCNVEQGRPGGLVRILVRRITRSLSSREVANLEGVLGRTVTITNKDGDWEFLA